MTIDTRLDIPFGHTYDAQGRELTYKSNIDNYWYECIRDTRGNVLKRRDSCGYWHTSSYDTQNIKLSYKNSDGFWYEYTRDTQGRELTYKNSDGFWTTLAIDQSFILRHNDVTDIYWAGCRKFTAEQALDHWSVRDDSRAMRFTAAIINHLEAPA